MTSSAATVRQDLTPGDFGLDSARFPSYRPQQLETALGIAASDKRFSCLSAPPGGGKSPLYMTVARVLDARTLVLTATKGLQLQLLPDFSSLGMLEIKGQANYRCVAVDNGGELSGLGTPGSSCSDGPCHVGVHCTLRNGGCDYYDAVGEARDAQVVVTNYAYWLAMGRHSDPNVMGQFDLLVMDEAHAAADWLTKFCAVELNRAEIKSLLGLTLPPVNEGVEVWAAWAKQAAARCRELVLELRTQLKGFVTHKRQLVKQLLRLTAIQRELEEMARAQAWRRTEGAARQVEVPGQINDWIAFETPKGAKFSPVWAHQYAEQYLFRAIPKVVLASGTLLPSIIKRLGIPHDQHDWHEVKSAFDAKRRPIIYVPTTRMDNKSSEGQHRIWANRIDQILSTRLDRKVLIPSVSYDRAEEIKARSEFGRYMLTHSSKTTQKTIERFKRATAPCILVSPAVVEGVDFPFDQVRCIIIVKVPFASSTDPVFKARCKADPAYRFECAAQLVIQSCGRGMRAATDWCEVVVIDDHFSYLRNKTTWPLWFRAAWVQMDSVPAPLTFRS